MTTEKGSSLLEMIWALFLGIVLAGACYSTASRFQVVADAASAMIERDASLRLLPLLCSQWLSAAGCSLEPGSVPPPVVSHREVRSWADLDGPGGIPDGDLDEPFENIAVRVSRESLTLRSGAGTFQPALSGISSGSFRSPEERLIVVDLTATARTRIGNRSFSIDTSVPVAFRNFRENLVPK